MRDRNQQERPVRIAAAAVLSMLLLVAPGTNAQRAGNDPSLAGAVGFGSSPDQSTQRSGLDAGAGAAGAMGPGQSGGGLPYPRPGANDGAPLRAQEAVTGNSGALAPLSADEIANVLQTQPDTLVELKALMADLAQQQGAPVQADAITDEALYRQIATNADLRANITTFLRARGYQPDAFHARGTEAGLEDELPGPGMFGGEQMSSDATDAADVLRRGTTATGMLDERTRRTMLPPRTSAQRAEPKDPEVLHRPAPYNLLSLRDLYTQLPEEGVVPKRFGSEVFLRRGLENRLLPEEHGAPLDVPARGDYVLGPGDNLAIDLWGGVSLNFSRTVDRDGKLSLPEAGPVQVAGLPLEQAQGVITSALKHQYRNVQVAVTMAHVRSIRVYVVGDVQRPGAYDISSLATPLNALYASGGPTATGSLRVLRHYRGHRLVGEVDLYDFLLRGVVADDRMESGDTVLVPPSGPQVTVYGAVKRPAIYEVKEETTLAAVLDDAGGARVSAELQHIVIERIGADHRRETVSLPTPPVGGTAQAAGAALAGFAVRDGDRVHISAILPYSQRVVYTEGHVARPGRMPYHEGMELSEVLHSYRDLLPEPASRGEIVRLVPPDLHPETIQFDVPEMLLGNVKVTLQPFDTIRVFGRYETDAPKVTINGEVLRPGTYALSEGMTAAQLVRLAGGFKRDALLTEADLASYNIVGGTRVVSKRASVPIGDAVRAADRATDVRLKPGDVLTIHQLTGWNDIGASITIEGEVAHPGSYGFQQGERLSSVLRRAGGLRDTSYPAGAVLLREEVRKLEDKSREELIHQIETSSAAARIRPSVASGDQAVSLQLIEQQQNEVLTRLRSQPANGRLVIHISADIGGWENTPADIEVRAGDVLRIPKRPGFVLVSGQVYNASAITFTPGRTAGWYLRAAGGATEIANTKQIFVIRANGSVVGRETGSWLGRDVLSTKLDAGDVVVVPQKIIGNSQVWRNLLTVAQITSSIAITAAVAGVL